MKEFTRDEQGSGLRRLARVVLNRPVLAVFVLAFGVRAVTAIAIYVVAGGTLFLDDATYFEDATRLAESGSAGFADDRRYLAAVGAFLYPLSFAYKVLPDTPLVGQVFVALLGAGVAAIATRLALEALGPGWAALAGAAVAIMPSQVLWGSLVLKDPFVWFLAASMALALAIVSSARGPASLVVLAALAVPLVALGFSRQTTMLLAAWALAMVGWVGRRDGRFVRLGIALTVALLAPIAAGEGPGGSNVLVSGASAVSEIRTRGAEEAKTAVVDPSTAPQEGATDDLLHIPRGLSVILLEPYPWQELHSFGQRLALAENLVWWPLILLALIGLVDLRRHARVLAFPLLVGGGLTLLYALSEGNFGTAFRHRGELVWIVCLFAVFGARRLHARWARCP